MLKGRRVLLRPLTDADFETWRDARIRCADWLAEWEASPIPNESTAVGYEMFDARRRTHEQLGRRGTGFAFGIFVGPATDHFAGEITLWPIERGAIQSAQAGYWIDKALAGNCYAPEALAVLLRFAFEDLGLHRVEVCIIPRNFRSHRVAEKVGLRSEGIALRFLQINDTWEDHGRYAMTSEEYFEQRTTSLKVWLGCPAAE